MLSIFFKILLIYGLYIFIRTVLRGFKFVKIVRGAARGATDLHNDHSQREANQERNSINSINGDDVYEAKCRVKEE